MSLLFFWNFVLIMENENEIDITITIKLAIKRNGDSTNARELKLNGRNEPPRVILSNSESNF